MIVVKTLNITEHTNKVSICATIIFDPMKLSANIIIPYIEVDAISKTIIKPNAIMNFEVSLILSFTCRRSFIVVAETIVE